MLKLLCSPAASSQSLRLVSIVTGGLQLPTTVYITFARISVSTVISLRVYVHAYLHTYMYKHVYVYIHIHVHIYPLDPRLERRKEEYIYTYIYMHIDSPPSADGRLEIQGASKPTSEDLQRTFRLQKNGL